MSRWRRFTVVVAALLGALLVAGVAAFATAVSIDASRWREAAARQASAAIGRTVVLRGALELRLGRELLLRVGDMRIANAPGFGTPDFMTLGDVQLRVDLLDALRGRPRLRSLQASDMALWLERDGEGRGNWSMAARPGAAAAPGAFDLGHITLRRLALHYSDARSATRRDVELDELIGTAGSDKALRLDMRGRLEAATPFVLRIEAGPLRELQEGAAPWPFTLDIKAADAWVHAVGGFDARRGEARFDFGSGTDELARSGLRLGMRGLPPGPAALYGHVAATAQAVVFGPMQGTLGGAEFGAQLALDLDAPRARLRGALQMATFDPDPFLVADASAQDPSRVPDAPPRQAFALRESLPLDLDLELKIGRWLGLGVELGDVHLSLHADARGARVPIAARLAGMAVAGVLQLHSAAPTPTLTLEIGAKDLALGPLSRALSDGPGINGRLARIDLRLAGRGDNWAALVRELHLSVSLAGLQWEARATADAPPVTLKLDTLTLAAGRGERLRGSGHGALLGERARLAIRGGTLPDLLGARATPLELDLQIAAASLGLASVPGRDGSTPLSALRFDFQAPRSGALSRWLAVAPSSALPIALRGRLRRADDAWRLEATTLRLGRTELRIDAQRSHADGRAFTKASVRSAWLDLPELATLSGFASTDASNGGRIDAPLLSAAVELADADLDLELQHVVLARTAMSDVALRARTREGRLLPSTVSGQLTGAPFSGQLALDLLAPVPWARLELSAGAIDLGALLRGLDVAEDIDGRVDGLQLMLYGSGNSLRELAATTALDARVVGGIITVRGAAGRPVAEIGLREASVGAAAGAPVQLRLDGTLDQIPVRIVASSGRFVDFLGDATRLPLQMTAQAAGARLSLDGAVSLPLGREGQLRFDMGGERLDSLNGLARVELPAWGPWSFGGPIRMTPSGYELQGLVLRVGQSRLDGSARLLLDGPRPALQVQVSAPMLQLDDFPLPPRLTDAPAPLGSTGSTGGVRGSAGRLASRTDRLLSANFLRRIDANIDVHARQVMAGADRLVDGALHLQLKDGRLDLDPVVLNLPGGSMRLSMAYDVKESEVDFAVSAQVDRFDYGIIARRLNRADDLRGLFSLNLDLVGQAPSLDSIMRNASGRLDFAVWPTELRSGMFDLWSANLVLTLLPLIDPGVKSEVNCIVGRLDMKHGDLTDDKILIDTTRVRIRGAGHANLATEELAFVFRPRAKGLGLYRLQTPLRVSGTLSDQRFGVDPGDVYPSVLRLIASPILVPIEWLTLGPLPRDGADVCTDPLRPRAH